MIFNVTEGVGVERFALHPSKPTPCTLDCVCLGVKVVVVIHGVRA